MRKKKKIGWIVAVSALVVLLSVGGVLVYTQANNIKALRYAQKYTKEQQAELLQENESQIQQILEKFPEVHVQPLNPEQEEKLQKGELSQEEALNIIMGQELPQKDVELALEGSVGEMEEEISGSSKTAGTQKPVSTAESTQGQAKAPQDETTSALDSDEKASADSGELNGLFAKVYLLRSTFSGKLDQLITQAQNEYSAQGGKIDKAAFGSKYLNKGKALEAQCDAEMNLILGQIEDILKSSGGDTGVLNEMREAYNNEKSIKKAALLEQYM